MDSITEKLKRGNGKGISGRVENTIRYGRDVRNLSRLVKDNFRLKPGKKDKKGSVRAILAFDTTSSMGEYRARIRDDLGYLIDGLHEMLSYFELAIMGCGDHCDGPSYLQINPYSSDVVELKKQISGIADTFGGDEPEAFECLFYELNNCFPLSNDSTLILLTDSVPHGMKGLLLPDSGCPFRRDYRVELEVLKKRINGFYIINCRNQPGMKDLQRGMVEHDKFIMDYDKIGNLATLVMGMCMSDVGRLGYMMRNVEKGR